MTQTSFPFEGIDTTETQFSRWARHFNNGVNDEPTGDKLEVSAGTGLAVDVEAGEAMVRGHYYISDAVESLALATADATNDRLDTVVLRLDPTANNIVLAVKTGTPAGSPAAPALVQTDAGIFEQALANVLVPANSGVPTTITDRREFMGTRLGSWTTDGRPVPAGRVLFGFNTTLDAVEFYNPVSEVWGPVAPEINSLDDIGDVTITTPADGELLAYDDGTSEWVNQALTAAQLPTGSILQVVSTTKTDIYSIGLSAGAVAATNVTGLEATITPLSTSSKILVYVTLIFSCDIAASKSFVLYRDTTAIGIGDAASARTRITGTGTLRATSDPSNMAAHHMDTPATTSAITYGVRLHNTNNGESGTIVVNRGFRDNDFNYEIRGVSTITVMEVAG